MPENTQTKCIDEEQVLRDHARLADGVARRSAWWGMDPEDARQTARLGLLKAWRTYNSDRGAFSTHATSVIRREGQRAALKEALVYVPINHATSLAKLRRLAAEEEATRGRVDLLDVARRSGSRSLERLARDIVAGKESLVGITIVSLEASQGSGDENSDDDWMPLAQRLRDPTPTVEERLSAEATSLSMDVILREVARLPARERRAVELRFLVEGMSSTEVAEEMGISRQSYYNLITRAVARLRLFLGLTERLDWREVTRRMPSPIAEEVIRLWNSGHSCREIAAELGVSQSVVSTALSRWPAHLLSPPRRGSRPGEWGANRKESR